MLDDLELIKDGLERRPIPIMKAYIGFPEQLLKLPAEIVQHGHKTFVIETKTPGPTCDLLDLLWQKASAAYSVKFPGLNENNTADGPVWKHLLFMKKWK